MKQLTRPVAPHPFNCDVTKKGYYQEVCSSQEVKARWNDEYDGERKIYKALVAMTNNCCAYCGMETIPEIDHYLPKGKGKAPYLAYCWENLLPACSNCNRRKGSFFPESLKGQQIIETCAEGIVPHDHLYDQIAIMNLVNEDRLIDPTYDQVEQHFTFHPEFYFYTAHSSIGRKTKERFFDHEVFVDILKKASEEAKIYVVCGIPGDMFEKLVTNKSKEFYLRKYYDYWMQEQAAGRMR